MLVLWYVLKSSLCFDSKALPILYFISANKQPKGRGKNLKSAKSRQTAARVALMKLKGRAEGDKGVPDTERVFFSVALPLASKFTPKALFFSKVSLSGAFTDLAKLHKKIINLRAIFFEEVQFKEQKHETVQVLVFSLKQEAS